MEFRDHLKKTRANLQWSDHCYFNIGLKSNKAIAKTVQAKEDFEKSDHCYHTFLSNSQHGPVSCGKSDHEKSGEILGVLEQGTENTEQQKENVNHIVLSDSKKTGDGPNLKLKLEGINEFCALSGKMPSGKETLSDLSNSPEINLHGEVVSLLDRVYWENMKLKQDPHQQRHPVLSEEVEIGSCVGDFSNCVPVEEGSKDSQASFNEARSHLQEDHACISGKACDVIHICLVNSVVTPTTDRGEISEMSATNNNTETSVSGLLSSEQLCNLDEKNEDNSHCQKTPSKSTAEDPTTRRSTVNIQNRRKRSDHSYCDTSSKKLKKPKVGKSDHTYMKSSSREESDVPESTEVSNNKGKQDSTEEKSSTDLLSQTVSANLMESPNLISGSEKISLVNRAKSVPVPLNSMLTSNTDLKCDNTNIALLGVLPFSKIITELPVGDRNINESTHQMRSDFNDVLSGIGEEIASRASRTQQVIEAFHNVTPAEPNPHFTEENDGRLMEGDILTTIHSSGAIATDQNTPGEGYAATVISECAALGPAMEIPLMSLIEQFSTQLGSRTGSTDIFRQQDSGDLIVTTPDQAASVNIGVSSNNTLSLSDCDKHGKELHCHEKHPANSYQPIFMVGKGNALFEGTTMSKDCFSTSGDENNTSLHVSVLVPQSAVSAHCSLLLEASCAPFTSRNTSFSQSTGATENLSAECEDTLPSASCIPVKLSTNLPMLHNLESGGYSEQSESVGIVKQTDSKLLEKASSLSSEEAELCTEVFRQSESETKSEKTQSRLPQRKCKKPRLSVMYDKRSQLQGSKKTIGKPSPRRDKTDIVKSSGRKQRGCNTSSGAKVKASDSKLPHGQNTKKHLGDGRISVKKQTGSSIGLVQAGLVAASRKLLQAVIIDHTYEEDKFLGQQVSVERDHTYGQGRLKTRKSKLRLQGTNSNFVDHNYESLA